MTVSDWDTIEAAKIHNNRRIRVPPEIGEQIIFEHSIYGDSVHWSRYTEANMMVISHSEPPDDRYSSAGTSQIHKRQNTVTPPKELLTALEDKLPTPAGFFEPGEKVVYLATEKMTESEPYAYYFMRESRLFELIDENTTDDSLVGLLKYHDLSG